ncbi:MAG: hypothetical protein U9N36_02640, partial [Euryarchaeota archaeon]|nr:hypothetical protein [Euryarchaeota archaeon]
FVPFGLSVTVRFRPIPRYDSSGGSHYTLHSILILAVDPNRTFGSTARIKTPSVDKKLHHRLPIPATPSIQGNPTAECVDGNAHVVSSAGTTWKI